MGVAALAMTAEAAPKKERAAAFAEADCPVCHSNMVRFMDTLTPEQKKDGLVVEDKLQTYCDKVQPPDVTQWREPVVVNAEGGSVLTRPCWVCRGARLCSEMPPGEAVPPTH